jgi:hypothetical protein
MRRLGFSLISVVTTLMAMGGCASEATTPAAPAMMGPVAGAAPVAAKPPAGTTAPMGMTGMPPGMAMPPASGNGGMVQPMDMPPAPPGMMPGEMPPMVPAGALPDLVDPGTEPWVPVPEAMVGEVCKMDIAMLNAANKRGPLAVVRYGQLCYESTTNDPSAEIWSVTKTLGAVATGMAMYQTRDIAGEGPKMGKLDQFDRVDKWLDSFSFNQDALVAHVLAMVAQNGNLDAGGMMYDTVGSVQINRLSDVVNTAIAQDSMRLGANLEEFFQKFIVMKLGLESSSWSGGDSTKVYAYTWNTTLRDMARVGLLELNGGIYNKERLLSANYVYNMGHASFENATTAYGYLTWMGGDSCAPVPVHRKYPHGASSATDCGLGNCEPMYDVGAFYAGGMGGQFIQVHRGLDMVILGKNWGEGNIQGMWAAVRPSVVAMDEMFKGDEAGFCTAYGAGNYAPDLKLWEGEDPMTGGLDSPPVQ